MSHQITVVFIMELIGTIAFACSGAMVAVKKQLDLLGIIVLGVITAVGGGIIRDLLLGITPPVAFVKPIYLVVALISVTIIFMIVRFGIKTISLLNSQVFESILNLFDAIGLGVFTIVGVNASLADSPDQGILLHVFLGVLTGVGGGMIRDMMVGEIPFVLKKHIYACASLTGALVYFFLSPFIGQNSALVLSTMLVTLIRILARHYQWNLPKAMPD